MPQYTNQMLTSSEILNSPSPRARRAAYYILLELWRAKHDDPEFTKELLQLSIKHPEIIRELQTRVNASVDDDTNIVLRQQLKVLEAELHKHQEESAQLPTEEQFSGSDEKIWITLTSSNDLQSGMTTGELLSSILPYLQAVETLQEAINDIENKLYPKLKIFTIQKYSQVSVSLEGVSSAIQTVQEMITPWKRKHSEVMARFAEQEKQVDIEIKKAEILERRALAEKERIEARKQREAAEKMRLENQKLRIEVQQAKLQLALSIVTQFSPNADDEKKILYLTKFLPSIDIFISTDLEIVSDAERT